MERKKFSFSRRHFTGKLDSLLAQIGKASAKDLNSLVLDELAQTFGPDLKIQSGCLYRRKGANYEKIRGPVGAAPEPWPVAISRSDPAISLVMEHKAYIFADSAWPPWGNNSVAVVIGEENQFLMAFRLFPGWERELIELSLNSVRNTLNYIRSTRSFGMMFQEAYEIQKSLLPKHDPCSTATTSRGVRSLPSSSAGISTTFICSTTR